MSVIIPYNRIIGNNGNLTGYAGDLPAKKYLLELEQSQSTYRDLCTKQKLIKIGEIK